MSMRVLAGVGKDLGGSLQGFIASHHDLQLVGCVQDGAQLLQCLPEVQPDVLVLDLIMPHVDGLGVLEWMATEHFATRPKVIVLSIWGQENMIHRLVEAGADYCLLKPIQMEVLVARVRQLCIGAATQERPGGVSPQVRPQPAPIRKPMWAEGNLENRVARIITHVGVPAHISGYRYLRQAVRLVVNRVDLLGAVTKELYPTIARDNGSTPSRVERAIRHAIEIAWTRGDAQLHLELFGPTLKPDRGKPTNSEFIALLADRLRMAEAS